MTRKSLASSRGMLASRTAFRGLAERLEEPPGIGHPAEDSALGLDHGEGGLLELGEVRGHTVLEDEAVVAAVVRLADAGVDADLGRHAADDELRDPAVLEDRVEVRRVEGAFARLVDHGLAGHRRQLLDDVVPVLSAHEDSAHRARIADAGLQLSARLL